jgi:hypothetical protein
VPPEATGAPPAGKTGAVGATGAAAAGRTPLPFRVVKAFAGFWWDFLIGDTPELFVGVLVIVGIVLALVKAVSLNSLATVALPGLVVVLLAGSVLQARRGQH